METYRMLVTSQGENEYLGFSKCEPTARLNLDTPAPRLDWYSITRYYKYAGELLAAFELLLVGTTIVVI